MSDGVRRLQRGLSLLLALFLLGMFGLFGVRIYFELRGHGRVHTQSAVFTESAKELKNPNRGFYHIHGFRIVDEETDFQKEIFERFRQDTDTSLALIEINLQQYAKGEISSRGLANIRALFEALSATDKQLIIRFLYNWDGETTQSEPDDLSIILGHMEQLGPILKEYEKEVFLYQGLFTGRWGEMNGTSFSQPGAFRALAEGLAQAAPLSAYLAVRTPAQWRNITGIADPARVQPGDGTLASRLGLFNDGMLGNQGDYGTYGASSRVEQGAFSPWNREEELAFQDQLCRIVPLGGEVINDNPYNDFENALEDFSRMHVTYLNRDYDAQVLDKWAEYVACEEGCFQGMDGLSYMERHLGYRLVLREASFTYDWKRDSLKTYVTIQNVGFAPLYREVQVQLTFLSTSNDRVYSYEIEQDLRQLCGGTQAKDSQVLSREVSLWGEQTGSFQVYLDITDRLSGQRILLGNEKEPEKYGYFIGEVELGAAETFWEEEKLEGQTDV
ncbi:DUF4832 domain-containing protein [Candidatus Acetatifactor stercoripullorum]|uniref:DUF4832 domain-containing protein n=1 Tax=Candidatus Acetatifactor stercoripullorum TaxID=2838414 RepID=UPI00298E4C2E|nr:DUF4832 domain-containing protein [Candidatus Acetatifactor stercoripullorum]